MLLCCVVPRTMRHLLQGRTCVLPCFFFFSSSGDLWVIWHARVVLGGLRRQLPKPPGSPPKGLGASEKKSAGVSGRLVVVAQQPPEDRQVHDTTPLQGLVRPASQTPFWNAVSQACFEARDDPTFQPLVSTKRSVGPEPNKQPRINANARKSEEHVRAYSHWFACIGGSRVSK